jgi:hydrogenase nickel incorporation protein HypB
MDMDKVKVIELKQNIFRANEVTADKIRERLKKKGTLLVNVMASPGAGKTTLLSRTIHALEDTFRCGVMECDIDASVDAQTLLDQGIPAVQLHTGGMCHMDAE